MAPVCGVVLHTWAVLPNKTEPANQQWQWPAPVAVDGSSQQCAAMAEGSFSAQAAGTGLEQHASTGLEGLMARARSEAAAYDAYRAMQKDPSGEQVHDDQLVPCSGDGTQAEVEPTPIGQGERCEWEYCAEGDAEHHEAEWARVGSKEQEARLAVKVMRMQADEAAAAALAVRSEAAVVAIQRAWARRCASSLGLPRLRCGKVNRPMWIKSGRSATALPAAATGLSDTALDMVLQEHAVAMQRQDEEASAWGSSGCSGP